MWLEGELEPTEGIGATGDKCVKVLTKIVWLFIRHPCFLLLCKTWRSRLQAIWYNFFFFVAVVSHTHKNTHTALPSAFSVAFHIQIFLRFLSMQYLTVVIQTLMQLPLFSLSLFSLSLLLFPGVAADIQKVTVPTEYQCPSQMVQ